MNIYQQQGNGYLANLRFLFSSKGIPSTLNIPTPTAPLHRALKYFLWGFGCGALALIFAVVASHMSKFADTDSLIQLENSNFRKITNANKEGARNH